MAGTRLSIDKDELKRLQDFMEAQAARSPSGLMPRLGEYLMRSTQERFDEGEQKAPDGTPWKELKERYRRRKKYHQDKVLTLRGYLRSYIHYRAGLDSVEVGSNLKYAAIHQFGGTINMPARQATARYRSVAGRVLFAKKTHKRGVTEKAVAIGAHQVKIHARPFLGISAEDDREIQRIIREWLAESD